MKKLIALINPRGKTVKQAAAEVQEALRLDAIRQKESEIVFVPKMVPQNDPAPIVDEWDTLMKSVAKAVPGIHMLTTKKYHRTTQAIDELDTKDDRKPFKVYCDDMFHYMDESARLYIGSFETLEEAKEKCAEVLVESLFNLYEPDISEEDLVKKWWAFGEDPWILDPNHNPEDIPFSAYKEVPAFAKGAIEHEMSAKQHGLVKCEVCGEYKGKVQSKYLNWATPLEGDEGEEFIDVTCICEGIPCAKCKKNKIHRPISNSYNEEDNSISHAPYFAGMMPCSECKEKEL
ncbi:hypothetical protein EPO56_03130 [Patescibacteria group bacterium]|nr:MAG: hypothetical protein EPO56_03130 [Patescibacteria group bacterium]